MLDGTVVSCDGIVTVPVKFQDTYVMGDFYVMDKASHGILGFDILSRLNANIDIQNCQVIVQNNVSEYMKQETPEESKSKIATVCQTCKNHSGAIWKRTVGKNIRWTSCQWRFYCRVQRSFYRELVC